MTTPNANSLSKKDLMQHAEWLRDLARILVRDPHTADDHTQETLLEGLSSGPMRSPRAWLATVLRRKVALARTRGERVRSWEREATRHESTPSTEELVARAGVSKQVIDAVLALAAPYRQVVLLRFYEGIPPREIAARLDRPVGTVKIQLNRGLQQIRDSLDASYGNDGSWRQVVAPLGGNLGRLALGKVAATAASLIALIATGFMLLNSGEKEFADTTADIRDDAITLFEETKAPAEIPVTTSPFVDQNDATRSANPSTPTPPESIVVVDSGGVPIENRSVKIIDDSGKEPFPIFTGRTDARGVVDIGETLEQVRDRAPTGPLAVVVQSVDGDETRALDWKAEWTSPLRIEVKRGAIVEVTVVDEHGELVSESFVATVFDQAGGEKRRSAATTTGRARIDAIGNTAARVTVWFQHKLRDPLSAAIPGAREGSTRRLTLTSGPVTKLISGTIVDEDGNPASGKVLFWILEGHGGGTRHGTRIALDAHGRFRIPASRVANEAREVEIEDAKHQVWKTRRLRVDPSMLSGHDLGVLTAFRAPVLVSGRVLDADGTPIAGALLRAMILDQRRMSGHWTQIPKRFKTAEDGTFEIRSRTMAQDIHLTASCPDGGAFKQPAVRTAVPSSNPLSARRPELTDSR